MVCLQTRSFDDLNVNMSFIDVLARLSIHLLADCHDAFVPLAGSLLNPETIPNMAIILLLDWTAPWTWARQVQKMILFLQRVIDLIAEDGAAMLLKKARSRSQDDSSSTRYAPDTEVGNTVSALTSKPGEWGEALDLPLCIICQYAERMLTLEREQNWRDAQFDFVQQYLRAITLKYGGSLIYTASSVKNQLPSMINLLLGIEPVSQRDLVKPNVVDRDKIVVPCNWDSWTKIRILDDGFPAESISGTWSKDMHAATSKSTAVRDVSTSKPSNEAVIIFEATIVDPHMHRSGSEKVQPPGALEVEGQSMQEFLKEQLKKADTPYNTKVKSSSKAQGGTSRRQSLQTIVEKRGRQDLTAEGGNQ